MNLYESLPDPAMEVTPELERRILPANREAHALHLAMFPTLYVEAEVISDAAKQYKANSFNRNFRNMIATTFSGAINSATAGPGSPGCRNVAGAICCALGTDQACHGTAAPCASGGNVNIITGSSDKAEAFDDYRLRRQPIHIVPPNGGTLRVTCALELYHPEPEGAA